MSRVFPAIISGNPQDDEAFFFSAYLIARHLGKQGAINFYLDTGSPDVVVGENDLARLDIKLSDLPRSPRPIAGWGGKTDAYLLDDTCVILTDSGGQSEAFPVGTIICGRNPKRVKERTKGFTKQTEVQTVPIPSVIGRAFLRDHNLVARIDVKRRDVSLIRE